MKGFKEDTFNDRMKDAAKARAARLEKARAKDPRNDPEFAARQAERIRIAQEREKREAERKAAKLVEQQRAAEEAAAAERAHLDTVALSGGCFQNAVLLEQTERRLRDAGFTVLTHSMVPANDGGLALGQAAIAAARLIP